VSQQPSDWQQGVLAAAKWLATVSDLYGNSDLTFLSRRMVSDLESLDSEGTEARVIKQIAGFFRDVARTTGEPAFVHAAEFVEDGSWKPK
jgi:hypothetical protein